MNKIEAADPLAHSADLVAGNIEQLKVLFPELISEGPDGVAINMDVLKALVGDKAVTDAEEKYGLNWHGKRRARQLALTPSTGTLRPYPEESVEWDTTQNLMIEGDNLEVIKLLQKSYAGKIKLIYIDPPYNTGKDFVYPDNFQDSIGNYLKMTGQIADGQKTSTNTESSGRFHTDWLNMMYPRLKLARALLRDDGAIFISIDDGELANLKALCCEIFGEENFIATFIWEKRTSRENRKVFSFNHDYIVAFAKNADEFQKVRGYLPFTEEVLERYSNPDNDPRGEWQSVALSVQGGHGTASQFYEIETPGGRKVSPPSGLCWRFTKERLEELAKDNRIWFGAEGNNVPRLKVFLAEARDGLTPHTLWKADEVGTTDSGKRELLSLFDGEAVFDTVKPTSLVKRILQIASRPSDEDVICDFFAGSGTTGHAVIAQNAADGGNRRFILVQLPAPIDGSTPEGQAALRMSKSIGRPNSLATVTEERLRRASALVAKDNPLIGGRGGFRIFKLDSSNIRAWVTSPESVQQAVIDYQDSLIEGRSEADVLYELLIKRGLDLCVPIEVRLVAGRHVYSVGAGVLMACLAESIAAVDVEELARGIVEWHRVLAPAGDTTCVFRDGSFVNDVAKTNMAAILQQSGVANVRSL